MAKQFFKDLPDTTTPLTATRLNGLLDGEEALGNLVVDSIRSKNMFDGVLLNGVYNDTTGIFTPSVSLCSKKIKIKSSTSYYLSGVTGSVRVHYWNNGTYVGNEVITAPNSFVSQGNITAFQFAGSTPHSNIQLEIGSSATTYTPYQELNPDNFKNEEIVVGKIRSKNLINKNKSIRNIGTFHSALSTGVRVTLNVSAQYMWSTFELPSNLLGKIITISSTITPSASNNGKAALFFGNSSNDPVGQAIASLDQTGSVTTTIPASFPSGTNKIILLLYGNVNGTGVTNNYVDYTNLQVEEGSQATNYMPYQDFDDKEIYLTEETVIGTFLGKPLYRKVFTKTGTLTGTQLMGTLNDVDTITYINGTGHTNENNVWIPIPATNPNNLTYQIEIYSINNSLNVGIGSGRTLNNIYIVIEYTKTTD